jgi:hypothetical protein
MRHIGISCGLVLALAGSVFAEMAAVADRVLGSINCSTSFMKRASRTRRSGRRRLANTATIRSSAQLRSMAWPNHMKIPSLKHFQIVMLAAFLLSACATSQPSATTVSLLISAGFRLRTPETPKQKEIFATLTSYKLESVVVNGRKFYVYKDEAKGMALVGHEAEYEHYRQMAKEERSSAAHHNMMMANTAETANWRGAASSDWWQ